MYRTFINPSRTVEATISPNGKFFVRGYGKFCGYYGAYRHQNLIEEMNKEEYCIDVALTVSSVAVLYASQNLYVWGSASTGATGNDEPVYVKAKPQHQNVSAVCATSSAFMILKEGKVIIQGQDEYHTNYTLRNTIDSKIIIKISSTPSTFTITTRDGEELSWGNTDDTLEI
jgi:hypothetical protein